jgi:hypothetical protein
VKWLETHKHLAIVIVCIAGLAFIANQVEKHRERMADKEQAGLEIKLNAADAQMTKNDKAFSDFKTEMLQQIGDIKTAKQGVTVLQPIMQGAAPQGVTAGQLSAEAQSQLPAGTRPDTHYNLFTDDQVIGLARNADQCKIDEKGLSTCAADKLTMQGKIDDLIKQNKKWEDAGTVPRWTAMLGVSKTRAGATAPGVISLGGYKPALMLSYRVTHHTGLAVGVVNDALVGGININFGGQPK